MHTTSIFLFRTIKIQIDTYLHFNNRIIKIHTILTISFPSVRLGTIIQMHAILILFFRNIKNIEWLTDSDFLSNFSHRITKIYETWIIFSFELVRYKIVTYIFQTSFLTPATMPPKSTKTLIFPFRLNKIGKVTYVFGPLLFFFFLISATVSP